MVWRRPLRRRVFVSVVNTGNLEKQVGKTAFKEVTKEQFKNIYFRLGGGDHSGWTAAYWQEFFEDAVNPGWRFMVEEPRSPEHDRMWIVTDQKTKE